MKSFLCVLMTLIFRTPLSAQTIVVRQAGVSLQTYRQVVQSSFASETPMAALQKRLSSEDLPESLQAEVDRTLTLVAENPDQSAEHFEVLAQKLEIEPRSAAVRETLRKVLERLQLSTSAEAKSIIEKKRAALIEPLKRTGYKTPTLLQKEILQRMQIIRQLPGAEDSALFWNGFLVDGQIEVMDSKDSQWILVSSQWQPKILNGSWSDASHFFSEKSKEWVQGTCDQPVIQMFGSLSETKALFANGCEARLHGDQMRIADLKDNSSIEADLRTSEKAKSNWVKPALWGTGLLAAGLLVLSISGKTLRVKPLYSSQL